jgi:hypothetical protein
MSSIKTIHRQTWSNAGVLQTDNTVEGQSPRGYWRVVREEKRWIKIVISILRLRAVRIMKRN